MLDRNVIAQLSQLKQDIVASKDLAEGQVTGSSGRYGFVKLDDGRNAFLNPDKMQHVIPGDRVRVNIVKNDKDQLEAEFEDFISAGLSRFVGTYKVKNGAHFVVPEDNQINRWIFIPPQSRLKCKENDLIVAELLHHPYEDGKASAKAIARIGTPGDDYIHHNLVIARFGIHRHWSKDAQAQAKEVHDKAQNLKGEDLSALPFVTIDAPTTRDMDDAIYAKAQDDGWQLWVAIANPGAYILPGTPIAKSAKYYGQSVYLPGKCLPMLPDALATDTFSLVPNAKRPALVCQLNIGLDGEIKSFEFKEAHIQSHAKLSYQDVSEFLEGENETVGACSDEVKASLRACEELSALRNSYRQEHNIIFDDQFDYDLSLNKQGLIESISQRSRTLAHRLVEESMLAVNLSAGELLASKQSGVFSSHQGFRPERIGEVRALLREEFGADRDFSNIEEPDTFIALIKELQSSEEHGSILAPLKRMMQPTELSAEPSPHLGMGFPHYATLSSPIRRYADISNQWSILKIINGQKAQKVPEPVMEHLRQAVSNSRQASRQLEQILWTQYLSQHIGYEGKAIIRIVTQQGFGVRLLENGIEGFVQFGKKVEKSFDAKRMTLTVDGICYALDQEVDVKVAAVDLEKRRVKMQTLKAQSGKDATKDAKDEAAPESTEANAE